MRRELLVLAAILVLDVGMADAGIVTNANQGAAFVRMPARNATLGIDGVYYNPAGLTKLSDGWHFSLYNQSAFRNREVETDCANLNDAPSAVFPADAQSALSPGLYAVYKADKSAFSFGFNRIAGLGHADFSRGLPVFEQIFSDLVPALHTGYGVTGYSAKMDFDETATGLGFQLGVSYEVDPAVSLFGGGRLVTVKRTYGGGIRDVSINPTKGYDGSYRRADAFASQNAASFTSASQSYSGAAASVQSLISAGAGNFTIAQVQAAGYISSAERASYEGALANLGLTSAQIASLNMNQVHTYFNGAKTAFAANAALMTGIQALTGDRDLDVTQTGAGFAPILGMNLTLAQHWTVGLKYEFATKVELENDTRVDQFGTFPDGAKVRSDLPGMFSMGVSYAGDSPLLMSSSLNYYFDRNADYGMVDVMGGAIENRDIIDANYLELAAGVEYTLNKRLLLSLGYMYGNTGVSEEYQSLIGFSLDSHTLGFGGRYLVTPDVALDLGCSFMLYRGDKREYLHYQSVPVVLPYGSTAGTSAPVGVTDRYSRSDVILGVGVDYAIRK